MKRKGNLKGILIFAVIFACMSVALQAGAEQNPFADLLGGTVVCFPHIATTNGWGTEVALINPTPDAVNGSLRSYSAQGAPVSQAKAITLKPNARVEFEVVKDFADPNSIAYMVFESAVFGVKGYTKFYRMGNRVSIMASGARMSGIFTKVEQDGYTGIAFVNMESAEAKVTLTAYNDDGGKVAETVLSLKAGEKKVELIGKFFEGKDIGKATYVTYTSDKGLVGFFLNGSGDGTMLDGSQAL
jgi:hypothetical protein